MEQPAEKQAPRGGRQSEIAFSRAKSILTEPSGFIDAFDYTLNPYSGCTFGCNYCYAANFASTDILKEDWGKWVKVKENALELLIKWRKKPLDGKTIYMSSVTDPYQPVERGLELTRSLLEELIQHHKVRLVVQTRGPLVTRDIDLLQRFEHVQVNMTITTDNDAVRRQFEPTCPSIQQRLNAIQRVREAGIQSCITMTPLLPVIDPNAFAERLLETGVPRFVVQFFHAGSTNRFAAGTGREASDLARQMNWNAERYAEVIGILRSRLPDVREGKDGFAPPWKKTQSAR